MPEILKGSVVNAKSWAPLTSLDSTCLTQLRNVSSLPWTAGVSLMPDGHGGYGVPIGSVVALKGAIMPMGVGSDIACGMGAALLGLTAKDLPDSFEEIRKAVEDVIPTGPHGYNGKPPFPLPLKLQNEVDKLLEGFSKLDPKTQEFKGKMLTQLGTLGGGNHFIEFCLDKHDRVWIMLHSGSRKIGNAIADIHTRYAMKLDHNKGLPDKQLSVLLEGTAEAEAYKRDLYWAQEYARLNRQVMLVQYQGVLKKFFPEDRISSQEEIWCHHNYVAEEIYNGQKVYVTRKGAIRAGKGEMGIIPGSMGAQSFLVRGLGSEESFNSASHGAGRKMPRRKAKEMFREGYGRPLEVQLKGLDPRWEIECIRNGTIADELPDCYKDITEVMANQTDLVEVYQELHQLMVIKGGEEEDGEKKAAKHEKQAKEDSEFRKDRKLARQMKGHNT